MMKRSQRGDAGVAMLVMMVVMMIGGLWYGGMKHDAGSDHTSDTPASAPAETPLDLLDAAYARGEIGREEYLQKREDLMKR